MKSPWSVFCQQFQYEWLCVKRQPRFVLHAFLFFVMISVFFPLTLPANPLILKQSVPGFFWVALLLALLLASERFFQQEYEEGILEQWLTSGHSLPAIIWGKLCLQWLVFMLPLCLFLPVLMLLFDLSLFSMCCLLSTLVAATPGLFALCTLAAAFGTGLQQKGILMALILLPLTLPFLMMGSSALSIAGEGSDFTAYLAVLTALSLLALSGLPLVTASIIRIGLAD